MNNANAKKENKKLVFRKFTKEDNEVWKILCERQLQNLKGTASKIREEGWKILGMETEKVPDFIKLNKKLKALTGWEVALTNSQYEDTDTWARGLANKQMRITQFIRNIKDLDYTPLPDIFHDVFGHVPFFAVPQYARISQKFGEAMMKAKTKEIQDKIANHYWYTFEFGLIKENGVIKALGTGLMSSTGELKNALSEKVLKLPYEMGTVNSLDEINLNGSPHEFHKQLFILENLDQLEAVVDKWL